MEQLVNLGAIVVDPALQPRQQMDMAMVLEYAGEMQAGAQFPPVVAFGTVEQCWLADGFHRIEAAKMSQSPVVKVELRPGGRREAQLFSLGANATHGLRRTNADKRRAVETALRDVEWTVWSDREVAQRCAVSAPLVAQVRMELGLVREERKVERGGVVYTMQTAMIGKEGEQAQDLQDERMAEEVPFDDEDDISFVDEGELRSVEQDAEGKVEFGDEYEERAQDEYSEEVAPGSGVVSDAIRDMGTGNRDFEQGREEPVEFGEEYVEQSRVEAVAAATGGAAGVLVAGGTQGDVVNQADAAAVAPTLPAPAQRFAVNQATLPAPARSVPVLVPPAQAIPAPKLPAPATVVVLEARIIGEMAVVTIGESGQAPRVMRHANKDALVEVLGQVLAAYFTV